MGGLLLSIEPIQIDKSPSPCETVNMKNITVTVDDETYRKARVRAAELDTSVSAVVRKFLSEFAEDESRFERLRKQQDAVLAQIEKFTAEDRLSRDELHDRALIRRDIS